jgi:hypothetical protein
VKPQGKNQMDYYWFDNRAESLPNINAFFFMKPFSNQPGLVLVNYAISFVFNFIQPLAANDIGNR